MTSHQAAFFLFDLAIVVLLSRIFGALAGKLRQPPVIGEIVAGVLAGPTLIGHHVSTALFPADVQPFLTAVANIGVAFFMFQVGAELNVGALRRQGSIAATVSVASIALPFGLGALLATFLARQHPAQHHLGFVLFLGAAMSVTAFPVLARILTDSGIRHTTLGNLALASAAIGDVLAWILLAFVVVVSDVSGATTRRLMLVIPYLAAMLWIVRPALRRYLSRPDQSSPTSLGVICAGVLASGAFTEWIGLHLLFGAFLFGAVLSREERSPVRVAVESVERFTLAVLLPVFFIVAGLKVDLTGLNGRLLVELVLIILVAVTGKFGGVFLAARAHRLPARRSALLATLMNTRGLTELIILTVGLQIGVLDQRLYSIMVVMALVTTAMAGSLLRLLRVGPESAVEREPVPEAV